MQRRVHDGEQLAAAGVEEIREEVSGAGALLEQHIAAFSQVTARLEQRCSALERQFAAFVEDSVGRFEALAAALGEISVLR